LEVEKIRKESKEKLQSLVQSSNGLKFEIEQRY
jgi:hypothetical protein